MVPAGEDVQRTVNNIFSLYQQHGAEEYAGEKVSQLEHMSQAAQMAELEGYDEEVVLAAFFHDIGHLIPAGRDEQMDGFGVKDHEKIGADYLLQLGFSPRVCALIASHVAAKRYLTYKNPLYYGRLSDASKETLKYQGGPMSESEAKRFEDDPYFNEYLKMRYWDESAKIEGIPLPELSRLKEMALKHLLNGRQISAK